MTAVIDSQRRCRGGSSQLSKRADNRTRPGNVLIYAGMDDSTSAEPTSHNKLAEKTRLTDDNYG